MSICFEVGESVADLIKCHPDARSLPDGVRSVRSAWSLCYDRFVAATGEKDAEELAVYLSAYLTSWGMMRGSSFLKHHNFTVHEGAARIVLRAENRSLIGLDLVNAKKHVDEIVRVEGEIRTYYDKAAEELRKCDPCYGKKLSSSAVLTSKILLGTLGCCVGFDKFVVAGLKTYGLSGAFDRESLAGLIDWGKDRAVELASVQNELTALNLAFPHMKLIDMYFWMRGKSASVDELRLTKRLLEFYTVEEAKQWLRAQHSDLGNKRAIDLVKCGRTREVEVAISRIETGSFS
jgi:hypothetical protein